MDESTLNCVLINECRDFELDPSSEIKEIAFSVERLKRYLQQYPEKASQLAIDHFTDFLVLAHNYKKLKQDYHALQADLTLLQFKQPSFSPQLPDCLP